MKAIVLTILFANMVLQARLTDVYYSNGIYNTYKYAKKSALDLNTSLSKETFASGPDKGKNMLDANYTDEAVILQYNWSADENCEDRAKEEYFCVQGKAVMGYDILETYYQLKTSGQIDRALGFFGWLATLVIDTVQAVASIPGIVPSEAEIAAIERQNVDAMVNTYLERSIHAGQDILLISHSQGNLFANRVYDVYFGKNNRNDEYYRFANIQVASPADYVHAFTHDYISRYDDSVISWVPGSLDPNLQENDIPRDKYLDDKGNDLCYDYDAGNHHSFIDAYIGCSATWNRIKTALNNFHNGKNGDGGDMPSGGCSYNPNAKHFDVMLVLMSLLTVLYPLYHGARWIRRRYG